MEPVTRRKFIVAGSAGALGVAGGASLGPRLADGADRAMSDEPLLSQSEISGSTGPAMLAVRDARAGEVELLIDDRSVVFTDKRLVARLLRAGR